MKTKLSLTACTVAIGLGLAASPANAWKQAYPEPVMKYPSQANVDAVLDRWWDNWKTNFLNGGLVKATDPSGNPKFVSEAQAYGMLLSVWMNDQAAFNQVYDKAQGLFWSSNHYGWLLNTGGTQLQDANFAGDADLDIAGALIFASILVDKKIWTLSPPSGRPTYKAQASAILAAAPGQLVTSGGNIFSWPGQSSTLNPSYHMPSWYPVFKDFASKNAVSTADWDKAITAAYALFTAQTNSSKGMARSWSNASGGPSGCGNCQSSPNIDYMGFDAIRVPWRIGLDAIWYKRPAALSWIKSTWSAGVVSPVKPGMYDPSGPTLVDWCDGSAGCTNKYERVLTRSMWGANAVAGQDSFTVAMSAANQIMADIPTIYGYIGDYDVKAATGTNLVDKNYYTQSLGIFGMMAMTGNAPNIWDDLNYPWVAPDTLTHVTVALKASPDSLRLTVGTDTGKVRLTATLNKNALWRIYAKGRVSGSAAVKQVNATAASKTVDGILWSKSFTLGETVDVKLYWPNCSPTDTGRITVRVVAGGNTGVISRPVYQIPGIQRLDGSILRMSASLPEEEIQMVRFLDAKGSVIATTHATRAEGGLRLDQVPALRGITFFDVVMRSARHQGRLFGL